MDILYFSDFISKTFLYLLKRWINFLTGTWIYKSRLLIYSTSFVGVHSHSVVSLAQSPFCKLIPRKRHLRESWVLVRFNWMGIYGLGKSTVHHLQERRRTMIINECNNQREFHEPCDLIATMPAVNQWTAFSTSVKKEHPGMHRGDKKRKGEPENIQPHISLWSGTEKTKNQRWAQFWRNYNL